MKKLSLTLTALGACIIAFGALITYLPKSSAVVKGTPLLKEEKEKEIVSSTKTYINHEKNYSINYPKDWQKQEFPRLDLVVLSPPRNAESQMHATMNLVSETVGNAVSLEQFYMESVKHLKAELTDVVIEKTDDKTIHGIATRSIQYSHAMGENDFRVLQYFLLAKDNVYLMTFSASAADFAYFYPTFESIASSFQLIPQTPEKKE